MESASRRRVYSLINPSTVFLNLIVILREGPSNPQLGVQPSRSVEGQCFGHSVFFGGIPVKAITPRRISDTQWQCNRTSCDGWSVSVDDDRHSFGTDWGSVFYGIPPAVAEYGAGWKELRASGTDMAAGGYYIIRPHPHRPSPVCFSRVRL
ncbi:predicted protein [Coccidioides posadasii str. Silveira]|uniref:Predicted protein n=2 Tax=Coccidioides posadasii TaxID=199306 RepID=E9DE36_COCPS|nr:predicted protein [Coccidioides posadasii str. Silveira]KMM70352.1 hypothetical protein CPAG_06664 [Coccidioides posadasii RMSCC 3488]